MPLLLFALGLLLGRAPAVPAEPDRPAARAGDTQVSFAELDRLLLDRYALSETGRKSLLHLLKGRVLEMLAEESGVTVSEQELDAKEAEIERDVKRSGQARDLADYLVKEGVERETFRHYLRLGLVQEKLARQALGIPPRRPITGEQQEMWLEERMGELGVEDYDPPWKGGYICRCGPIRISVAEFAEHLRGRLEAAEVREACVQLLQVKRLRARMPDLSEEALAKAAEEEVRRRALEIERDPKYEGVTYAQLLESQGIRFAAWPRDPAILLGVLARTWVERSYTPEQMKRVYSDEREHFDGLYGEAIDTWAIFLRAGRFDNDLLPRTYEEAEEVLRKLAAQVRSRSDFERLAREHSEDAGTREEGGHVGWVTRAGKERHLALKNAIFGALDAGTFDPAMPKDDRGRLLGPVRTSTGCVLFWLGDRRPTPGWETMIGHVASELRQRFVEEALDRRDVLTFLDEE